MCSHLKSRFTHGEAAEESLIFYIVILDKGEADNKVVLAEHIDGDVERERCGINNVCYFACFLVNGCCDFTVIIFCCEFFNKGCFVCNLVCFNYVAYSADT